MAVQESPSVYAPGLPSGGWGNPGDVGSAQFIWDPSKQAWTWGWQGADGSVIPAVSQPNTASGYSQIGPYASGYKPDPGQTPPASISNDPNTTFTAPGGGSNVPAGGGTALKLFKVLAPIAGSVVAGVVQSKQIDKAVQAQQDAAQKALELSQNIYTQQRTDLAPYRAAGGGALNMLNYGLGITPQDTATIPAFQPQAAAQPSQATTRGAAPLTNITTTGTPWAGPGPVPVHPQVAAPRPSSLAGLPQPSGQMVQMVAPNGMRATVPSDQVPHYTQLGARVV